MAELRFFYGPMSSGKSTLAIQTHHNLAAAGRAGRVFSAHDRAGPAVSSRIGISVPAEAVELGTDFSALGPTVADGRDLSYLVCDEAQFYTPAQVDALAALVDDRGIDVYAFGLLTDFCTRLFPGSARLIELADARLELQLAAWCWCGRRGVANARVVSGGVVYEGERVLAGDVDDAPTHYVVLCRRHWRAGAHRRPA